MCNPHTHTLTHSRTHSRTCTHTRTHSLSHINITTQTTQTHAHTQKHKNTSAHTHTHTHARTHTRTHTHTHTSSAKCRKLPGRHICSSLIFTITDWLFTARFTVPFLASEVAGRTTCKFSICTATAQRAKGHSWQDEHGCACVSMWVCVCMRTCCLVCLHAHHSTRFTRVLGSSGWPSGSATS